MNKLVRICVHLDLYVDFEGLGSFQTWVTGGEGTCPAGCSGVEAVGIGLDSPGRSQFPQDPPGPLAGSQAGIWPLAECIRYWALLDFETTPANPEPQRRQWAGLGPLRSLHVLRVQEPPLQTGWVSLRTRTHPFCCVQTHWAPSSMWERQEASVKALVSPHPCEEWRATAPMPHVTLGPSVLKEQTLRPPEREGVSCGDQGAGTTSSTLKQGSQLGPQDGGPCLPKAGQLQNRGKAEAGSLAAVLRGK